MAVPPEGLSLWHRVWNAPSLPQHRQTLYKLYMNVLPIGASIRHFAPDDVHCHFCIDAGQSLRHFIFACPLVQQVWQDFACIFSLPSVPFSRALYSWPSSSQSFLGRANGYQLQAGHAIAIAVHTLWFIHCRARYDGVQWSRSVISRIFIDQLRRHFSTLSTSSHWHQHFETLPPLLYID